MKIKFKKISFLLFLALIGCSDAGDNQVKEDIEFKEITDSEKQQIKEVVYNITSPMQAAMIMKDANALYREELLNPVSNAENYYGSNYITALNLGIYGADLGYVCVYMTDVTAAFDYLRVSREMADNLGIYGAFETSMVERFQSNLQNRDSMMVIVGESFELTDKYLKENKRSNVSAMIVAGSWIEGLYLSTKVVQSVPTDENDPKLDSVHALITRSIAEQKPSLQNLMALLEVHKDNKHIERLLDELKDLKSAYENVTVEEVSVDASSNAEEGMTMIGNETNVEIPAQSLMEITLIIEKIRMQVTNINS